MKKGIALILAILLCLSLLAGCGSNAAKEKQKRIMGIHH